MLQHDTRASRWNEVPFWGEKEDIFNDVEFAVSQVLRFCVRKHQLFHLINCSPSRLISLTMVESVDTCFYQSCLALSLLLRGEKEPARQTKLGPYVCSSIWLEALILAVVVSGILGTVTMSVH